MEIRHLGCGGEVNIGITDDGQIAYICQKCAKSWTGTVTPYSEVSYVHQRSVAGHLESLISVAKIDVDLNDVH